MKKNSLLFIAASLLFADRTFAYQVLLNTAAMPSNAAVYLNSWVTTASRVDGSGGSAGGIDGSACLPTPGTPCENETSCQLRQWQTIVNQLPTSRAQQVSAYRGYVSNDPDVTDNLAYAGITNLVESLYAIAAQSGYTIGGLALNDGSVVISNVTYGLNWDLAEAQLLRTYLDQTGRTNAVLIYDVRNNGATPRKFATSPLIDTILIEAQPHLWYQNSGSRQDFLKWVWTNAACAGKKIQFLIPPEGSPPTYSATNDFMSVRRLLVWLGGTLMDYNFMRSTNVQFNPVSYNSPTMTYYPEVAAQNLYTNTMTSIYLSLIEQRDLFEGRSRIPTQADADSFARTVQINISAPATNEIFSLVNQTIGPLPFTVGDGGFNPTNLTLSARSGDPTVVASTNIVFGGAGTNRTVTVTPLPGRTGTLRIYLTVSDGTNSASTGYKITVVNTRSYNAVMNGHINDTNTWGRPLPVAGDTNAWGTGSFQVDTTNSNTEIFNGRTFVVDADSSLVCNAPSATLQMNNLILDGGKIAINNNLGFTIDLKKTNTFTLNSGTINTGGGTISRNIIVVNARLAGNGSIDITGSNTNGFWVELQSTVTTTNFTGVFSVHDNGLLKLPAITKATFGLNLSGSGMIFNQVNLALNSLVIDGINFAPGTYAYTNFTASQQTHLLNSNGVITVVAPANNPNAQPVISAVRAGNGRFSFTINGTNGPDYIVQTSTNLTTWSPLLTNYSPQLPFSITNATTNFNQRFYRVLLGP